MCDASACFLSDESTDASPNTVVREVAMVFPQDHKGYCSPHQRGGSRRPDHRCVRAGFSDVGSREVRLDDLAEACHQLPNMGLVAPGSDDEETPRTAPPLRRKETKKRSQCRSTLRVPRRNRERCPFASGCRWHSQRDRDDAAPRQGPQHEPHSSIPRREQAVGRKRIEETQHETQEEKRENKWT